MRSSSGAGNVLDEVRRRDEQHLAQVERHAEIVIGERVVLRRVEHLEQRARRIALERHAELVDLVEQEDGILRAAPASCPGRCDPASRRRTCGDARGCRLRRARRRGRRARTRGRARARSTSRCDVLPTPGGPTKSRIGPFAIARAFASFLSVICRSALSSLTASDGVASSLLARSLRRRDISPVCFISASSCCARSWRTARNSSTRSFTSGSP